MADEQRAILADCLRLIQVAPVRGLIARLPYRWRATGGQDAR